MDFTGRTKNPLQLDIQKFHGLHESTHEIESIYPPHYLRELQLAPLLLLLAPIKGLRIFLFQKYHLHEIKIVLNKMCNKIVISLQNGFRTSHITTESRFH